MRDAIRLEHYSYRTEESYVDWARRYILFHNPGLSAANVKSHPNDMDTAEINTFLSHLATQRNVAASTQNPCTEPIEVRPSAPSSSSTAKCFTKRSKTHPDLQRQTT